MPLKRLTKPHPDATGAVALETHVVAVVHAKASRVAEVVDAVDDLPLSSAVRTVYPTTSAAGDLLGFVCESRTVAVAIAHLTTSKNRMSASLRNLCGVDTGTLEATDLSVDSRVILDCRFTLATS